MVPFLDTGLSTIFRLFNVEVALFIEHLVSCSDFRNSVGVENAVFSGKLPSGKLGHTLRSGGDAQSYFYVEKSKNGRETGI